MNKYQDALNLLKSWAKKDRDAYSPKHLENINNCANTLQELVDFNKTFAHVLGSIDFKALRNILETKLPKKPIKKETVTLSMLNIDVTFWKVSNLWFSFSRKAKLLYKMWTSYRLGGLKIEKT